MNYCRFLFVWFAFSEETKKFVDNITAIEMPTLSFKVLNS